MYRLKNFLKQNAEREFKLKCAHRTIHHAQMQFKQAFIQDVHSNLINSKYKIAKAK